jgi:hypothetical protein
MDQNNSKPFKWRYHPRKELQAWVEQEFPELSKYRMQQKEYPNLSARLDEVHAAVSTVLELVMTCSDSSIREYYKPDVKHLERAFVERDLIAYTKYLDDFIDGIKLE